MSKVEVNEIDKQSGSTLTLGGSGTAVTLACGATQTGFGRTGTVDWQTGSIKTTNFTAVNGQGFFVDTNSGAVQANLPAGTAGAIVSFQDYRNTFDTHALTIEPNGTNKINGGSAGGPVSLNTEGEGITLVYIDSTIGWRSIQDNDFALQGTDFISATGGTTTECGNFKIHTFTGPGSFIVNAISQTPAENTVGYQVVAGGGAGGGSQANTTGGAGGGGAGGFREGRNAPVDNFTASPLVANAPTNAVSVTVGTFPIVVGGGGTGAAGPAKGTNGANSSFSTITATGGGAGGTRSPSAPEGDASDGGSGGGGGYGSSSSGDGGSGNTPPVNPSQGNDGSNFASPPNRGGGGGGAGSAGGTASSAGGVQDGGDGVASSITGSSVSRSGGGGGFNSSTPNMGTGGPGGGADGAPGASPQPVGNAGTANTGGGGGGVGAPSNPIGTTGGNGGSGIVIIRYKFQ